MKNNSRKVRKQKRVRSKIVGTNKRPRLSVHRTNTSTYAQLIDDAKKVTILTVSEKHLPEVGGTKTEKAKALGVLLAQKAKEKKIKEAVFDRGSYAFHGRVKAICEGAKEGGLIC